MYPSDLTDVQWSKLEPLLQPVRGERHAGGRPRKYPLRRVVDAMLYVVKTGCQWRQLPMDFPPWKSVHEQFRAWRDSGVWEQAGKALREQGRKAQGRNATPSVAIVDSQSAKTALKGGAAVMTRAENQGAQAAHRSRYAGQSAGSDRTLGWHPGPGCSPRRADAVVLPLRPITKVYVDGGYTGSLIDWAKQMFGYTIEVVKRTEQHLFKVLPKRWIVERTFAWLNWSRRLSKDYEIRHNSAETMIHIAFAHQLLRRYT